MTANDVLAQVGTFLTDHAGDLREARDVSSQQLQAEPGNGLVIENLRVIGILQSLQTELARLAPNADKTAGTSGRRA